MRTKINLLNVLMMSAFIIVSFNAGATGIKVSGAGKITGNISSVVTKTPLVNATVTLFLSSDSTMVVGTITDNNGHFYFSMLEPGDYFLEISETGFVKQQISDLSVKTGEPKICLDEIMLKSDSVSKKKHNKLFKTKF
jgi:hypothetical protein